MVDGWDMPFVSEAERGKGREGEHKTRSIITSAVCPTGLDFWPI